MDLSTIILSVVGAYIGGYCFGFGLRFWRRMFEVVS